MLAHLHSPAHSSLQLSSPPILLADSHRFRPGDNLTNSQRFFVGSAIKHEIGRGRAATDASSLWPAAYRALVTALGEELIESTLAELAPLDNLRFYALGWDLAAATGAQVTLHLESFNVAWTDIERLPPPPPSSSSSSSSSSS